MNIKENSELEMPKFWKKSSKIFSAMVGIATIGQFLISNVYQIKIKFNLPLNWVIFICITIILIIGYLIYYIVLLQKYCQKLKNDLENENKKNNNLKKKIEKIENMQKKQKKDFEKFKETIPDFEAIDEFDE